MKVKMTNLEIYTAALNLKKFFGEEERVILPIMVNYSIQKNLKILMTAGELIDNVRNTIGEKYGTKSADGSHYKILEENLGRASKDMDNLMNTEELLDIKKIKLKDLEGIELSNQQMAALLFMIEEE